MRHKIGALAATTVFLAGGALATATSASAAVDPPSGGWDHTWTTSDSRDGGTVYIAEHGDIVSLCDTAADGYAPRVQIASQASSGAYHIRYTLTASGGEGSCASARASQGGVYDLPENTQIGVTIWLGPDRDYQTQHYYLNDH
ncbi:hypothetical protein ACIHAR_14085 [Streptomyces sp. NPDC052016]|jgi:hypothetical protein|uniref:hypothetical protein n=1 Tax=unclassified Streptomyces TaxID=2593676 RepID=UPI0034387C33